jgi:hypothetical protein
MSIGTDYTDNPEWVKPPSKEYITFKFRHYRDENNKPFATTCIFLNDENIVMAMGIALCSAKDNFSRNIGRTISFQRGMKAWVSKRNHYPIKERECKVIQKWDSLVSQKTTDSISTGYKAAYLKNSGETFDSFKLENRRQYGF